MKQKKITISLILFFLIISQCGCLDIIEDFSDNSKIIYESYPTSVKYQIKYGYIIDIDGNGKSIVNNKEDLPEVLIGSIENITIHNQLQSKITELADNDMVLWNETFNNEQYLFFGISADITCQTYIITDLEGKNTLDIQEIKEGFPDLIEQFCQIQGDSNQIFIDPNHKTIKNIAEEIKFESETNNSFMLAKQIFSWLKSNTNYQIHNSQENVQPSCDTVVSRKGDCDDLSFLYIALCRSLEIPSRFIRGYLISKNDGKVSLIPHVWVEVFVGNNIGNNGWIPVECAGTGKIESEIHQNFAIEDVDHIRLFTDNGSNESLNISTSHISVKYEEDISISLISQSEISNYTILSSNQLCIEDEKIRNYC